MKPCLFRFAVLMCCCQVMYSQGFGELELKVRNDSLGQFILAKNKLPTSITLKLKHKIYQDSTKKHIINARDSIHLHRQQFSSREAYLEYVNQNFSITYRLGDSLQSKPDLDYVYKLPFQKKKKYKVIQSWGGSFSHSSKESYHAIDFKMPVGEPVHAARGGMVVRSVEKFSENGGKELRNKANVIVIKHEDGSFAYYVHLMHNGSLVEIGQGVEEGELIGYSGNVGYSTTPHLHFVVRDGNSNSIPIYFINQSDRQPLKSGKRYKREK